MRRRHSEEPSFEQRAVAELSLIDALVGLIHPRVERILFGYERGKDGGWLWRAHVVSDEGHPTDPGLIEDLMGEWDAMLYGSLEVLGAGNAGCRITTSEAPFHPDSHSTTPHCVYRRWGVAHDPSAPDDNYPYWSP